MDFISLLPISNNLQSNKELVTNEKNVEGEFAHFLGSVLSSTNHESEDKKVVRQETPDTQDELLSLLNVTDWEGLPEEWQLFMYIDLRDEQLFLQKASELLNAEVEEIDLIFKHIQSFLSNNDDVERAETAEFRNGLFAKLYTISEAKQAPMTDRFTENQTVSQIIKLVQMVNQQTQPSPFNQQQLDVLVKEVITKLVKEDAPSIHTPSFKVSETLVQTRPMVNLPISIPLTKGEQSQVGFEIDLKSVVNKVTEEQPFETKAMQAPTNLTNIAKNEMLHISMQQSGKQVSSEQLIRQFENILSRSKFTVVNGIQKLSIQLTPENLGTLKIEIVQKDQVMIARIIASTHAAKEAFESSAQSLRQAFHTQNIAVDKIEIYQTSLEQKQAEDSLNQREKNQSDQEGHHSNRKNEQDAEMTSFFDELEAELLNLKV